MNIGRAFSIKVRLFAALVLVSTGSMAATPSTNDWQFGLTLYGWLPDVDGTLKYELPDAGEDVDVDIGSILDNLELTFMGTFEARRDKFSLLADVIYLGLGNDTRFQLGNTPVKGKLEMNSDYWVISAMAGYRLLDTEQSRVDLIGGLRYLSADISTSMTILKKRKFSETEERWDGIVGFRGNYKFNQHWYLPFHADVGAGDSDLTWQAMLGIGYRFGWGDLQLVYRHLAYEQSSDRFIQDLAFSGPAFGASFHF